MRDLPSADGVETAEAAEQARLKANSAFLRLTAGHAQPALVEPTRPPSPRGPWWAWCGLHGGSAATTLSLAVPGGVEIASVTGGWLSEAHRRLPVVAVCRSHAAGLEAAQWWAARTSQLSLLVLGLVVVADAPGRLPRPLESLVRLISGGYREVWRMPWVNDWRLGEPPSPDNTPPVYRHLQRELCERTGAPLDVGPMGGM